MTMPRINPRPSVSVPWLRLTWLLLLLFAHGVHGEQPKGKVLVSGPMAVQLTYDEDAIEPKKAKQQTSAASEVECSGGSLVAAMDCVTTRIEGARTDSQTREREPAEEDIEGRPAIHVTMSGKVTPAVKDLGNGTYELSILDAISMPQFSPGTPGDIKSKAGRDEGTIKLGLRKWHETLSIAQINELTDNQVDFSGPFDNLALFEVRAPRPQTFKVYWRSDQCDQLELEFQQAQTDYIAHVSAMPVLDQFELVTRTMDEIQDALTMTAEGVKGVEGKVGEVTELTSVNEKIDELMGDTEGLSSAVTQALEDIKTRVGKQHEKILESTGVGKPLKDLKKGLGQSAETMEKVAGTVEKLNKRMKTLQTLVQTADKEPSEQLRVFKDYFSAVQGELGGLIKMIPGLGVFLELYGQAIEQIADSVEQIEKIRDQRNQQAREAGIPEPYVKTKTARERAEAEKNKLWKKVTDLGDRVARECPSFDLSGQEYGEIQEIEDAKRRAEDACKDKRLNLSDEARIRREYREANRGFNQQSATEAEDRYRKMQKDFKKLQSLYEKVKRNSIRSKDDRALVNSYFQAYYTDHRRITEYDKNKDRYIDKNAKYTKNDMTELGFFVKDQKQLLQTAQKKRNDQREKKKRYDQAKAANDALNNNNKAYRACVKNHILGLAEDKGWDRRLVEVLNSAYFGGY